MKKTIKFKRKVALLLSASLLLLVNWSLRAQSSDLPQIQILSPTGSTFCWDTEVRIRMTRPTSGIPSGAFYADYTLSNGTNACFILRQRLDIPSTSFLEISMNALGSMTNNCFSSGTGTFNLLVYFTDANHLILTTSNSSANTINRSITLNFLKPQFSVRGEHTNDKFLKIFDCHGPITLKQEGNGCGSQFRLAFFEISSDLTTPIGTVLERDLTSAEISQLSAGTLTLNTFTASGQGVTLTNGKHYKVILKSDPGQATEKYFEFSTQTFDLTMKDNPDDYGLEPVEQWQNVFISEDLWNKRFKGAGTDPFIYSTKQDNPALSHDPLNHNRMYARIHNIGCNTSTGNTSMRFYWTRARTDEWWPLHWKYNDPGNFILNASSNPGAHLTIPAGAEITLQNPDYLIPGSYANSPLPGGLSIPAISSGTSYEIVADFPGGQEWYAPDPDWYSDVIGQNHPGTNRPFLCMLARMENPNDPISIEPASGTNMKMDEYARANNNVVTRNTILINEAGFRVFPIDPVSGTNTSRNHGVATVMVNNARGSTEEVDLGLNLSNSPNLFDDFTSAGGTLYLGMDDDLWNLWALSSFAGIGFNIVEPGIIEITSPNVTLEGINLPSTETYTLGLKFEYPAENNAAYDPELMMSWNLSQYFVQLDDYGSNLIFNALVYDEPYDPEAVESVQLSTTALKDVEARFGVYPNPFGSSFTIHYEAIADEEICLQLFDMQGKLVRDILSPTIHKAGKYSISLKNLDLEKGTYIISLRAGNASTSKRVISIK